MVNSYLNLQILMNAVLVSVGAPSFVTTLWEVLNVNATMVTSYLQTTNHALVS